MTPRARFWVNEKTYWQGMPLAPFCWMLGVILVSGCMSLLLPVAAYALQRWASTWNWQDRWTSLRVLATPGMVFVCCLLAFALLDHAQFWIVPPIISAIQTFWQAHLPGNLSLSPLDFHALVARLMLFLPLAPGLALLYEYIAPRTRTQPHRMLLQADLVVPLASPSAPTTSNQAAQPAAAPPAPASTSTQKPPAAQKKQPPLHRKRQQPGSSPAGTMEQMTIDRFLAETTSPSQKTETKATTHLSPTVTIPKTPARKPPDEPIDWDNVLE